MSDQHKGEELQGRAKETAGAATGDDELKREGKTDQTSAKTKNKVNEAVDKVKNTFKR